MLLGWRCLADCETGAAVSSHASRLLQAARRVVRPMAAASVIDRPEAVVNNEYRYSGEPAVWRRRADRSSWAIGAVRVWHGCRYSSPRRQRGGPSSASESQTGKPDGTDRRGIGFSLRRIGKLRRPGGRWFCFCGDPGTSANPPGGGHTNPRRAVGCRVLCGACFPAGRRGLLALCHWRDAITIGASRLRWSARNY